MIDLTKVDVFDMLKRLGLQNVRLTSGGREANFSCPGAGHAHGDERPSASMNVETTLGWCFGCHTRWTAISFVAQVKEIPVVDAQRWLRDTYGIDFIEPQDGSMVGELERRLAPPLVLPSQTRPSKSWLSMLRLDWDGEAQPHQQYMIGRGFARDTMTAFDIGYDYLCDRITIPIYGLDGELVGIKGRSWDSRQPKYFVIGDRGESTKFGFHPYEASQVVFNLHCGRRRKRIVVFEGELNAIALQQILDEHEAGHLYRPTAIGMSYMSQRHVDLVVGEADEVILFGDPDKAGSGFIKGHESANGALSPGAVEMLELRTTVRVVTGHDRDAAKYLEDGDGSSVIELIENAQSSLAMRVLSR